MSKPYNGRGMQPNLPVSLRLSTDRRPAGRYVDGLLTLSLIAMQVCSSPLRQRTGRGHVLAESLCALAVVSIGLVPLASLGTTGLAWLRGHEQLAQAVRSAGEAAEISGMPVAPMNRSHAVSAEGPRTGRLAMAGLAVGEPEASASLRGVALWLQP
ncbi:hypothetical protein LMG26411_03413 [Cupriavidus numazuensis]|uniref:Uncharacterized protein n=2 Tax=Cupriavidus numazuensis TaxID=221992 RepID=A0ABN7PZ14_9BURK|nr:hypothetical protein LMG26411_03413 [Cupriavidus numazuensis]